MISKKANIYRKTNKFRQLRLSLSPASRCMTSNRSSHTPVTCVSCSWCAAWMIIIYVIHPRYTLEIVQFIFLWVVR